MKQIVVLLMLVGFFFSLYLCCTTDTAGTGHDGEARVMGVIHTSSGQAADNIRIELLESDFNPVKHLFRGGKYTNELWAVTDNLGRFTIEYVPEGSYTLIGIDFVSSKVIYHPGIMVESADKDVGVDSLKLKGGIIVSLEDTLYTQDCYLFIPGTYYYKKVESAGINELTTPSGVMDVLYYDRTGQTEDTIVSLIDSAVVDEGTVVDSSNSVTKPVILTSIDTVVVGLNGLFTAGGSICKNGDPVEYRFDWGDTSFSSWLLSDSNGTATSANLWHETGMYAIRAQARSANNNSLISKWSDPYHVVVIDTPPDTINVPFAPYGLDSLRVGVVGSYMTGGSNTGLDLTAEYRFDWGDSTFSSWSIDSVEDHSWNIIGVYAVRAQARKIANPSVISAWSIPLYVTVYDTSGDYVTAPSFVSCPNYVEINFAQLFMTGGSTSSNGSPVEYRFDWGDSTFSLWFYGDGDTHSYDRAGIYGVCTQARSQSDTMLVSSWTNPRYITVYDSSFIRTPFTPQSIGLDSLIPGDTGYFATGGSWTGMDPLVEYRFDWGDTTFSPWSVDTIAWHVWFSSGTYLIRAQARSISDTLVISSWSDPLYFQVMDTVPEPITKPITPAGPDSVFTGVQASFITGGTVCVHDNIIEYRFDWDGVASSWSLDTVQQHAWYVPGRYRVVAQARSQKYPTLISSWSEPFYITVVDTVIDTTAIKTPRMPLGDSIVNTGDSAFYMTGGSHTWPNLNAEYRFDWGDSTFTAWAVDTTGLHAWINAGTYAVRAQARRVGDSLNISAWSDPLYVSIIDTSGDVVPPVITINPPNPMNLYVGSSYNEYGATAYDTVYGDLTSEVIIDNSELDTATVGTYHIIYSVSDRAGNMTNALRTVNVSR